MNGVDFGRTADDYARHRAGFPEAFFERLAALGILRAGRDVLDLGTGTGTLARGFATRGCAVRALDTAEALIEKARRLDADAGVSVDYRVARAEAPPFPDESFDVVAAGQCWHWFDRPAVAAACRRLLRPGGWLVIAHFDWVPLPGNVVEATEALIERFNPAWTLGGGTGFHPAWASDVCLAGFAVVESFSFDVDVAYGHEAWRGRIRASAGVGGSLDPDGVTRFDEALADLLARRFPEDPLVVPHRVWALVCRAPGASRGTGRADHVIEETARRWMSLWQGGDLGAFDELHLPGFIDHSPSDRGSDRGAFRQGIVDIYRAFPDFHAVIEDLVVDAASGKVITTPVPREVWGTRTALSRRRG